MSRVFEGTDVARVKIAEVDVLTPSASLLMQMKARSLPDRTQDDKRTKDLMDLCALVLYSGVRPPRISATSAGKRTLRKLEVAVKRTKEDEWRSIAKILNVSVPTAKRAARSIV